MESDGGVGMKTSEMRDGRGVDIESIVHEYGDDGEGDGDGGEDGGHGYGGWPGERDGPESDNDAEKNE